MRRSWKNTGKLIHEYRKKVGISQLELTNRVIGKSENGQFFWNIEAGKAGLPPKHLFATSRVLMLPLALIVEAMVQDHRDNLETMIKEELAKL